MQNGQYFQKPKGSQKYFDFDMAVAIRAENDEGRMVAYLTLMKIISQFSLLSPQACHFTHSRAKHVMPLSRAFGLIKKHIFQFPTMCERIKLQMFDW